MLFKVYSRYVIKEKVGMNFNNCPVENFLFEMAMVERLDCLKRLNWIK